ncbi:HAMP domain-containing histidine kinase [Pendulispora rubella]|uniref:histidine kinase n=1 Tax=Pendulispora rubella TaxID=2741070 RepID=A0ABZ2KWP8_9BACT
MAAKSVTASRSLPALEATPRTFGDIAPVLVHDFKGPLSAMALNLDFVLEQLPQDASFDVLRGALTECRHASDRIFRTIANVLDVTRCEEGRLGLRLSSVSLPELFARVVATYEPELAQREVDLQIDAPEELPSVDADADLLARVMHNLIDNALRNTRARGKLVLSAQAIRDTMEVRVKNEGAPIPLAIRNRLFTRTVGTEAEGMGLNRGLGLYFCRLVLQELGATIGLSEESGFPVCFVIRYPIPARSVR